MEQETWKPLALKGFVHQYEASSFGRVRRIPTTLRYTINGGEVVRAIPARVLKQQANHRGYRIISLQTGRGGAKQTFAVAPLVCAAFHGPRPLPDMDCAHLDGDKTNNAAANLQWVTKVENEAHKLAHGTRMLGERHHQSKLTEEDVLYIRRRHRRGERIVDLANELGVTKTTVCDITKRKIWKHLP